jgi:opacity protein-like surface antigen
MRHLLLGAALLGTAAAAAAQTPELKPFVSGDIAARPMIDNGTSRTSIGFDVTAGGPSWKGFQPIVEGGRALWLMPTGRSAGSPNQIAGWYGAGGVRYSAPRLWRFRPYAQAVGGAARVSSMLIEPRSWATLSRSSQTVPMFGTAAGVQISVWKELTVDLGYRSQGFYGASQAVRNEAYVGIGLSF